MTADFNADSYYGLCSLCGHFQEFHRQKRAIRETYHCERCRASLREREQARAILACYPELRAATLQELVTKPAFRATRLYEPGTIGPFRKFFADLPGYRQSDFYPEQERRQAPQTVPHQDLEALDYPDASFDLVITSDILEHVRHPERAFRELFRVLCPGGHHVMTVPMQDPLPELSVRRVDTDGPSDVMLLPEHYHGNGKGGRSLVYTDFGADISDWLAVAGFSASLRKPATASTIANRVYTVVCRRP